MKSLKILILYLFLASTSFGFTESEMLQANKVFVAEAKIQNDFPSIFRPIVNIFKKVFGAKPRRIIEYSANVTKLTLSRNEMTANCSTNQTSCSKSMGIGIYTELSNPAKDVINCVYHVSGGRIIGTGESVVWDLSGVAPGTYTITAGVEDSCGVCGQTQTKEIKVVACPDCK